MALLCAWSERDALEWRWRSTAADDWACTSHTGTTLIPECVRLGIEDGATAAADPQHSIAACRAGHRRPSEERCERRRGREGGAEAGVARCGELVSRMYEARGNDGREGRR